jgi:Zn-dependent M28 family amino/carboxypeptidase
MRLPRFACAALWLVPIAGLAQPAAPRAPRPDAIPAAMAAIREGDLKRDLYAMAGDAQRGREAGTLDEMRASVWVADQLRAIGVKPGAPDGTYFQWWNMRRTRVSTTASRVVVDGRELTLWQDVVPNGLVAATASAPVVVIADPRDSTTDVRGKVVVADLLPPAIPMRREGTNSYEYRVTTSTLAATGARWQRRGAAAVLLVGDATADVAFEGVAAIRSRGTYDVIGGAPRFATQAAGAAVGGAATNPVPAAAPVLLVRGSAAAAVRRPGAAAQVDIRIERFDTPSTNVVGLIRGTDPALRDEVLLFSSHQDHDGVRFTIDGDSVWAGADDNGTVSVALLAIARAMVRQPPRRSVLFVYHGAEERGLLGSRWHAANPVVPLARIVAVLNGDMIGRNHPDSASLLGIQPPHRNSAELVDMALRANALTGRFRLDSLWDRPTHPEGWYFRSDHVPYARLNVPALMYSTNLHADYHTPRDKPSAIDYPKLTRMTQWMYLTGWFVANAPRRPALDPGFRLER